MVQNSSGFRPLLIVAGLVAGLGVLMYLSRLNWIRKTIDLFIQRTLESTGLVRVMDYELLLRIQHGYVVSEMEILEGSDIADRTLSQSRPWDRGVVILSIKSNGKDQPGIPNAKLRPPCWRRRHRIRRRTQHTEGIRRTQKNHGSRHSMTANSTPQVRRLSTNEGFAFFNRQSSHSCVHPATLRAL